MTLLKANIQLSSLCLMMEAGANAENDTEQTKLTNRVAPWSRLANLIKYQN